MLTVLTVLTPPFFPFLGHFITFLLYLYISSSVDKSVDSVDRVYRLDIVGVRGSDLTVLLTALDAPLGAMFANRVGERVFYPHRGGDTMSSMMPTAEEDATSDDSIANPGISLLSVFPVILGQKFV